MDRVQVQEVLDDFIIKNDQQIDRVSSENPLLYNAVIDALDYLSGRFGTGVHIPKVEKKAEKKVEEDIKLGDLFIDSEDDQTIFRVIDINGEDVDFEKTWDNNFAFTFSKEKVRQKIEDGEWVKYTKILEKVEKPNKIKIIKEKKPKESARSLKKAIEGLELLESFGTLEPSEKAELENLRQKLKELSK